jgi:MFS family permease
MTLAGKDGRRRVYLIAMPISVVGSLGVATAQNMPQLLFWRILQCVGASPGTAVGAGVIGDIYKLEERGTGMGWFLAVSHLFRFMCG